MTHIRQKYKIVEKCYQLILITTRKPIEDHINIVVITQILVLHKFLKVQLWLQEQMVTQLNENATTVTIGVTLHHYVLNAVLMVLQHVDAVADHAHNFFAHNKMVVCYPRRGCCWIRVQLLVCAAILGFKYSHMHRRQCFNFVR